MSAAKPPPTHGPKNWGRFFLRLYLLPEHIKTRIIGYAVLSLSAATIWALNPLTELPGLQMIRWDATKQFHVMPKLRCIAETEFFAVNTVFVQRLHYMHGMITIPSHITMRFLGDVQRLFVNVPAWQLAKYRDAEVNKTYNDISAFLSDCPLLKSLTIAVVYVDIEQVREDAAAGFGLDELCIISAAVSRLAVAQKMLILCQEDMHVERRKEIKVVYVTGGMSVRDMLLACEDGTAVVL